MATPDSYVVLSMSQVGQGDLQSDYKTLITNVAECLSSGDASKIRYFEGLHGVVSENAKPLDLLCQMERSGRFSWNNVGPLADLMGRIKRHDINTKFIEEYKHKQQRHGVTVAVTPQGITTSQIQRASSTPSCTRTGSLTNSFPAAAAPKRHSLPTGYRSKHSATSPTCSIPIPEVKQESAVGQGSVCLPSGRSATQQQLASLSSRKSICTVQLHPSSEHPEQEASETIQPELHPQHRNASVPEILQQPTTASATSQQTPQRASSLQLQDDIFPLSVAQSTCSEFHEDASTANGQMEESLLSTVNSATGVQRWPHDATNPLQVEQAVDRQPSASKFTDLPTSHSSAGPREGTTLLPSATRGSSLRPPPPQQSSTPHYDGSLLPMHNQQGAIHECTTEMRQLGVILFTSDHLADQASASWPIKRIKMANIICCGQEGDVITYKKRMKLHNQRRKLLVEIVLKIYPLGVGRQNGETRPAVDCDGPDNRYATLVAEVYTRERRPDITANYAVTLTARVTNQNDEDVTATQRPSAEGRVNCKKTLIIPKFLSHESIIYSRSVAFNISVTAQLMVTEYSVDEGDLEGSLHKELSQSVYRNSATQ